MTTSHKPTFHPAVGSATQGGFRYHAPRVQFSARDLAHHTKLKVRQTGQHAPNEVDARDLKAELLQRETAHKQKQIADKAKAGLLPYANIDTPLLEAPEKDDDSGGATGRPAAAAAAAAAAEELGATSGPKVDLSQFDDADDEDDDRNDDDDDAGAEDDEAELLRELEKIKKEREIERQKKKAEEEADLKKTEDEAALSGNPLMAAAAAAAAARGSFGVKRRWDDDVVFRNQAKDERKPKKRFINDTIRSDFHRNFLNKYVK